MRVLRVVARWLCKLLDYRIDRLLRKHFAYPVGCTQAAHEYWAGVFPGDDNRLADKIDHSLEMRAVLSYYTT